MTQPGPFPAIGVSAIVFDERERVRLVRGGRPPAVGFWHAPGGKLEAGEGLVEGARREVMEETGVDVVVGPIMAVVERRQEGFHYVIVDFLARLADPSQISVRPADDVTDAAWIAAKDLADYPVAEGLLPILERARQAHRGAAMGLADSVGAGTDFLCQPAPPAL